MLFESSTHPGELTTLKQYVERMKPEQTQIFYLTGESRKIIENSPHLEAVRAKGYEVLYLSDAVDELLVQHLEEFEGKRLKSVGKGTVGLGTEEEKKQAEERIKKKEEKYKRLMEAWHKKLESSVKQVRLSTRLVNYPVCLVAGEHEYSPQLERLLQRGKGSGPKQRRILELNAEHLLIRRLQERFQANEADPWVESSFELLYELALIAEGSEMADPVRFQQVTLQLLEKAL